MPLYEYECQACGHRLEAQQKMADAPLVKCPKCGKSKLERLISATAFHLKGGGWYKDLYASQKPGADADSSGGASPAATATPAPSASTESPSTTAPAEKTATKSKKKAGKTST